jgi:hypothetical protein
MMTFPLRRSQWAKTKGLVPPTPGVSPKRATSHCSSFCRRVRRSSCGVVLMGNSRIHRCIVVQTFGIGLPGVRSAIATSEARLVLEGAICEGVGHVVLMLVYGSFACHSPSLCAIPRHTSGLRKSAGEQTLPCRYLYKRPLSKRASNAGARPWRASRQCADVSSTSMSVGIAL